MKATHSGHCQACGRLQKLPSNVLAKHGYTVTHGFFSGTCVGSNHKPFEVSCDMLPGFIASAREALASIEAKQSELRTYPTSITVTVRNYEKGSDGRSNYVTRRVDVLSEDRGSYTKFFYNAPGYRKAAGVVEQHTIETYGFKHDSVLDVAFELNKKTANGMEREAKSLRNYIAWQTERVASWKAQPLFALDRKDKEGFDPDAK